MTGVEAVSGEGGPTDDDNAVSFDADLARAGTDRIDVVRGDNTRWLTGDEVTERRRGVWTGEYFGDSTRGVLPWGGEYVWGDISTRGERMRGGESAVDTGRDLWKNEDDSPCEGRREVRPDKVVTLGEEE